MLCIEGIWRIFEDRLPIVTCTSHFFLLPAEFERCVLLDMKMKGTGASPTLSADLTSISTVLSSSISPSLCRLPSLHIVKFGIEAFWWSIAVEATLRGVHEMVRTGWLPHQPSHALDDVSTPVFDRALVIVIPSHILESVKFPIPESLIIWHASPELLETVAVFEPWET